MSFSTTIHHNGYDSEVEFWLEYGEQPTNVWLIPSRFNAERTMTESWHGAFERPLVDPKNRLSFEDWEIFEVEI